MHDCRRFEDGLVDLVFDALEIDEKQRRLEELESCDRCLKEYRAVTDSLLVFDQTVKASSPDESYWPRHHEAVRECIARHAQLPTVERAPFWRRGLSARISLPVPAAAVIVVTLLVLSVFAVRQPTVSISAGAPAPIDLPAKAVEVPVIQERVVTRTVYVVQKTKARDRSRRSGSVIPDNDGEVASQPAGKASGQGGLFTRANLTDFQPPDEMRIRIVKRSNSDEN